jgi:hypothetical protein
VHYAECRYAKCRGAHLRFEKQKLAYKFGKIIFFAQSRQTYKILLDILTPAKPEDFLTGVTQKFA